MGLKNYAEIWANLKKNGLPKFPSEDEKEVWFRDFMGGKINFARLDIISDLDNR